MLPKRSFKPAKCKTALNLAKSRIKLMKNKKDIQLKQLKKEVAQLLESGQDQTARIRVEHVVREEKMIEAYEMIEIYCELVVARLPIIESQKNCPLDLKEAIASLIFSAPRCGDIVELQDVRKHFVAKYGKEFVSAAVELRPDCGVSRNLIEKLSVKAPDGQKKVKILTAIAEEHNIKWEPNWFKDEDPMPSIDIPKAPEAHTTGAHTVEGNKIQMQPLNFDIADDLEEKHAPDQGKYGTSSQSHAHANNNFVPPSSTSHPTSRSSDSSSDKMVFSQPPRTAETESTFLTGRHNWNMEFKDATAAAESAELASRAARAAAELSSRSNAMSYSSSGPGHPIIHGQNKDNHMHRNSISGSYNQRSPRMENHSDVNKHGSMTEEDDAASLNDDNTPYGVQYGTGKQDFIETKTNMRQSNDSGPSTSGAEPNMFKSSYFQENATESSENPFYEETGERKNQSSSFQSQSSAFGDDYGISANSKYDDYKHDSVDISFGSFSRKSADQEDWHVPNAYTYGKEDVAFKDHRLGMDSRSDIFAGIDYKAVDKNIDEKGIDTNAGVFDDSGSDDDDDLYVVNPAVDHKISSPSQPPSRGFSLNEDKPYYERDLSESFKKSSIYTKLTEPLPVTFDDSDEEGSGNEKELQKGKSDPSYDYQKHDAHPHQVFMRSSYIEEEADDSFTSSKHVEENQNRYYGSVSKHESGYDDYDASPSTYNNSSSRAASTNNGSQSDYGKLDEEKPQKSMQSIISESLHPVSKFDSEAQSKAGGGVELNLGTLPGGRRNRAQWRIPRGASSPSESTEAASSDTFGSTERASTHEFQVSPKQTDNKQIPMKMNRNHMHYDSPDDEIDVVITRKGSNSGEGSYRPLRPAIHENVRKVSPKDPTGYFDSEESSSEGDVPKPDMSKTFLGAGLSRRTKGSTHSSVTSSESSAAVPKTRRASVSYAMEVSSSRNVDQSSSDDEKSLNSPIAEKITIPKSSRVREASNSNEKAPSRENSTNKPGHVHPKLPDFDTLAATLQSLRKNH